MTRRTHVAWVSTAQFDPHLRAGALYCLLSILRLLQDLGHRVSVLDVLTNDVHHDAFDGGLAYRGGEEVVREADTCRTVFQGVPYCHQVLPMGLGQWESQYQVVVNAVQRFLQQEGVDVVLTSDQAYWALLAAWRLQIPGAHFFHTLGNIKDFALNPGYIWLLRKRPVIAISRFMQAEIKARLGLDSVVWYAFIDLDAYRCDRSDARTKRIGFYSAGKIKGSAIVAQVAAQMPDHEFVVAGAYDEEPSGNLAHWGYIPDMRRFYGQIDLLLAPSTVKEAFPRTIVEAAVNGIPTIGNRLGGIPEAVGDSGALVDWNPEADITATAAEYVAAIRAILDDDAAYDRHRRKAFARAEAFEREQARQAREFYEHHIG
ncbi:MAG: glycosyltransferase family 4 protein [Chloroflexi bacterium]|nr:glycosyltransferase family 4 protein [Chloroflexota bacterium]